MVMASNMKDKPPDLYPANPEAERWILGTILLDNIAYNTVAESLRVDDFSLDSHRRVFSRMVDLAESGRSIDLQTLIEELGRHDEIEIVGGLNYVTSLIEGLRSSAPLDENVKIVREKARLRELIFTTQVIIERATEQVDRPDDILDDAESALFALAENNIGRGIMSAAEIVKESHGLIDERTQRGTHLDGLKTHFKDLDDVTGGLPRSQLITIAARPFAGKTALAMNIAQQIGLGDDRIVAIFSVGETNESLLMRLISSYAKIDAQNIRRRHLLSEETQKFAEGVDRIAKAQIYIDDTPGISVYEICAKCKRFEAAQKELDLVIVDNLQLVGAFSVSEGKRRHTSLSERGPLVCHALRTLARALRCPILTLGRLTDVTDDRALHATHQLSDLAELGITERESDVVIFLSREEVYKPDDPTVAGIAELNIAQQRHGPPATLRLKFMKDYGGFETMPLGTHTEG
jgi:replicative DNA helicase